MLATDKPVLIAIDDDEGIAALLETIAQSSGFHVEVTTTAADFEDATKRLCADVLILDLQIPKTDGIELLRSLAERQVKAGIVLVSGMDERTIAAAEQFATSSGLQVLGALQKPFVPDELRRLLQVVQARTRSITVEDLKAAIDDEQLTVYYQPTAQYQGDGRWSIVGMEALLRWQHPIRGLLGPDEFIELGEESGLGRAMTDFVIQRGMEQLKAWGATLGLKIGLRINIAAMLIADLGFPDRLEMMLRQYELAASSLTLEITETSMLDQQPHTFDILTRLRLKGINLAIDDFGIGYSSLTQLFRMPFNEMKIDKSLTLRVPQSTEANIMIEALVDLAHKLRLKVCAEGVETREALTFLSSVDCDCAQGFFISRPVKAKEIPDVIARWNAQGREQAFLQHAVS